MDRILNESVFWRTIFVPALWLATSNFLSHRARALPTNDEMSNKQVIGNYDRLFTLRLQYIRHIFRYGIGARFVRHLKLYRLPVANNYTSSPAQVSLGTLAASKSSFDCAFRGGRLSVSYAFARHCFIVMIIIYFRRSKGKMMRTPRHPLATEKESGTADDALVSNRG